MYNSTLCRKELFLNCLVEIIGDVVEGKGTKLRRIAAREIARLHDRISNADDGQEYSRCILEFVDLKYRLADPCTYFFAELSAEPEPYSAAGILFPSLVHLIRIEDDMSSWEWLPEQIRALGLAINAGDEVAWPITREFVTIKDRDGNPRPFYQFS